MATKGKDQTLKNRLRERAKLTVRGGLQRLDLDVSRGVFTGQVNRTLQSRGIDVSGVIRASTNPAASMIAAEVAAAMPAAIIPPVAHRSRVTGSAGGSGSVSRRSTMAQCGGSRTPPRCRTGGLT